MIIVRASRRMLCGEWSGKPSDTVTLTQDQRYRRRISLTSDGGIDFLLDLPEASLLRHGDGLRLEDGRIIEVKAEPEDLLQVQGKDAHHLLCLAWHLGNRHLEAQVEADRILIRRDAVIAAMLEGLGARLAEVVEPFNPEGGAYGHAGHAHQPHARGARHEH